MKLRFAVDQAACLRAGIDAPKSIVTVEVKPEELTDEQRELIADHMDGINICYRAVDGNGKPYLQPRFQLKPNLVMAVRPTLDALLEALEDNEREVALELNPIKVVVRHAHEVSKP